METWQVLAVVAALLIGATLGWLARGRRCRIRHAHLVAAYEPADLGTFFGEDDAEPAAGESSSTGPGEVRPGRYPGSALPGPGGAPPAPAYVVKAKTRSRIYRTPSSPSYARTIAEVWFRTAEDAEAAGFRAPKQQTRDTSTP